MTSIISTSEDTLRGHETDDTEAQLDGRPKSESVPHLKSSASTSTTTLHVSFNFDSPTDNIDPRNWPVGKKVFHTAIPALYGFVLTLGTSSFVPAIPYVQEEFKVSREIAILPLSLYTLGFLIGPTFAAPLSELYGRRCIYWGTMPLLLAFTAAAGSSHNFSLLLIMRFFAGFFGSGALAVGADLWPPVQQGRAALSFIMAPFLGPALGPLTGAYIINEYNNNWRWSIWVIILVAAPIAAMTVFMQETSKTRLQYLKEKKQGVEPTHQTGDTSALLRKLGQAFMRPLHMMFVEPLVAFLSIYTGFAFAMMFSFFGSYSYVFELVYHFNQRQVGLTFLGVLIGFILAVVSFGIFDATLYRRAAAKANAQPAPEHRLYTAMLGSLLLPLGLFWFAWTPGKDVHWIVPVLAGIPFGWGDLGVFLSACTYLVDVYEAANASSAIAANGFLRYGFGATFPLFTLQLYQALGIQWAGSLFAFVSLALLPVPWLFFWKGKELRKRSCYDVSKN